MTKLGQKVASENACITCGTSPVYMNRPMVKVASENACITCGTSPIMYSGKTYSN